MAPSPDDVIKKIREENARKEKEEKEKRKVYDRIFDKLKKEFGPIFEDDSVDPDDLDEFEKEMEELREEVWKAVGGDLSQEELEDIESDPDEFFESLFEELDDEDEDPGSGLLRRIKDIREQDRFLKEKAIRKRRASGSP